MDSQTPKTIQHYLKRKVKDPNEVSQHVKRTILKIENDIIKEPKSKYFTALYGSTQSESDYTAHRKAAYGEYRIHRINSHVANINSYTYIQCRNSSGPA